VTEKILEIQQTQAFWAFKSKLGLRKAEDYMYKKKRKFKQFPGKH